ALRQRHELFVWIGQVDPSTVRKAFGRALERRMVERERKRQHAPEQIAQVLRVVGGCRVAARRTLRPRAFACEGFGGSRALGLRRGRGFAVCGSFVEGKRFGRARGAHGGGREGGAALGGGGDARAVGADEVGGAIACAR